MFRHARCLVLLVAFGALALGCDSKPTMPATDPDSVEQLKKLQQQGNQGEGGKKDKKG